MSEAKKSNKKYIAKIQTYQTKFGPAQKVMLNSPNAQNADGSENTFYNGTLLWLDKETGKYYQVKQMGIHVPKEGMKPAELAKGYSCNVTLDLEDEYQVTLLQ
jgi:hypothetical protein